MCIVSTYTISLFRGPLAVSRGMFSEVEAAKDLRREYGDLGMTVEIVESMQKAIDHIHTYGRCVLCNVYIIHT